jgi:hypothetical protein
MDTSMPPLTAELTFSIPTTFSTRGLDEAELDIRVVTICNWRKT